MRSVVLPKAGRLCRTTRNQIPQHATGNDRGRQTPCLPNKPRREQGHSALAYSFRVVRLQVFCPVAGSGTMSASRPSSRLLCHPGVVSVTSDCPCRARVSTARAAAATAATASATFSARSTFLVQGGISIRVAVALGRLRAMHVQFAFGGGK